MQAEAMAIVAVLTVRSERQAEFEAYERLAATIMREHGGRLERVIREAPGADSTSFREVHVVTFAGPEGFAAYRADPRLAELTAERDRAIAGTMLIQGHDRPPY